MQDRDDMAPSRFLVKVDLTGERRCQRAPVIVNEVEWLARAGSPVARRAQRAADQGVENLALAGAGRPEEGQTQRRVGTIPKATLQVAENGLEDRDRPARGGAPERDAPRELGASRGGG